MACGKACIKYVLFTFNVIFWIAGLTAIGVGIWMLFDPGKFNELLGNYTFVVPSSILIATGLFVCIVGFCGCYGALKENKCMLGTYFTMLLLIFCAEIAAGVLAFLYRDKMFLRLDALPNANSRKRKTVLQDEITVQAKNIIEQKYGTGSNDIDYAVDIMQEKLKCCGAEGPNDYQAWATRRDSSTQVPQSCCSEPEKCAKTIDENLKYKTGCIDKLVTFTKDNMIILGGVGIGLACIQLLGMCFACCLFFSIDDY